jgi:2-polyprenyl-6-methoxyphenol hydroxylase-like FAD-dependent oxidoreductase
MRFLVAGGGIGDLVAALSLHDAEIEVAVVDSARRIDAIGAGVNRFPTTRLVSSQ